MGEFLADLSTLCLPPSLTSSSCTDVQKALPIIVTACFLVSFYHWTLHWLLPTEMTARIKQADILTLCVHGGAPATNQRRFQFRLLGISTIKLCSF